MTDINHIYPTTKFTMSASTARNPELFAEAPLPGPLELLVKELGVKMKPLIEAGAGQRSYTIVQCPAGAQIIEDIYRQYNEVVEKVGLISKIINLN